jgi:FkbM family methyltransferase
MNSKFMMDYKFINDGKILTIKFKTDDDTYRKQNAYLIKVSDMNTGLCIYSTDIRIEKGVDYDINVYAYKSNLSGFVFEIINKIGITMFKEVHDFGNKIGIFINGNNFKLKTLIGDTAWWIFYEIFSLKNYEYDDIRIEKGDIVLDIGANIGIFSIYASINGASNIYSVEASPIIYKYLCENTKTFHNIKPINYGISDKTCKAEFFLHNEVTGASTLYPDFNSHLDKYVEKISLIDINEFLSKYNITKIDFLKVDTEGSEFDIFKSLDENFLSNNVKKVFLEYHTNNNDNKDQDKIIDKLEKNGFEVFQKESEERFGMIAAKNKNL